MDVDAVLASLRVKPRLSCTGPKALYGPWRVSFHYDRVNSTFAFTLYYGAREKTMELTKEDVETRGKSMWMANNNWRLSPAGLLKVSAAAKGVIKNTEERNK